MNSEAEFKGLFNMISGQPGVSLDEAGCFTSLILLLRKNVASAQTELIHLLAEVSSEARRSVLPIIKAMLSGGLNGASELAAQTLVLLEKFETETGDLDLIPPAYS